METVKPSSSGCTIPSQYSFDASVCWSATSADFLRGDVSAAVHISTMTGSVCSGDDASSETQILQGRTAIICHLTQQQSFNTWTYWSLTSLLSTYTNLELDPDSSTKTVITTYTQTYEGVNVPSMREKCFPGPRDCGYKYKGAGCPDGHTPLSTAVYSSTSTLICCPL
ncbi:uncharacterized protein CC84DRAFT_1235785 [Paraphaeosphaeria sporulosa]|uniref:Uncharacterized protein n=1 Tax=Paraphaeosphaeria sporulosa TaxID=1460663 RepID=A0A177CQQ1_9PLEO|nr:uncharacterized protein CC84DRAFT_1235785 [Paraphaeosphaeria sporulosa]OAG09843.1 hypothetical protein CC84DRAFT_1235785 [Paraphaeosphaeria sporulosa]